MQSEIKNLPNPNEIENIIFDLGNVLIDIDLDAPKRAFDKISDYIEKARNLPENQIIAGGTYDDSVGYFINPTVILTTNPTSRPRANPSCKRKCKTTSLPCKRLSLMPLPCAARG